MQPDQRRILEQAATSGLIRLWRALLPLKTVVTFLQTGAHPDDEITRLLARLRSDGIRVAYVCATRGQGGQNSIGPESGADLGLLRTAEMEAAARILDFDLYWLGIDESEPITDFGFSKSGEDTLNRWGADHTLERMVRVIRTWRPDILCPTFLDVGGQHGHHRALTRTTEEAFHRAADPNAYPEHRALGLEPWAVSKYYLPAFSGAGGSYDDEEPPPPATLTLDVGTLDPMFGATPVQMGEWSRVHHLSQAMGTWHSPKPKSVPLHLKASRLGAPGPEATILDGLPRTLADLGLNGAQAALDDAFAAFPHRARLARALARAHQHIGSGSVAPEHAHRIARTRHLLERALAEALLFTADLAVTPARLTPGTRAEAVLTVAMGELKTEIRGAALDAPDAWCVEPGETDGTTWRFQIATPEDATFTSPLRFAHDPQRGLGAVAARVDLTFEGADFTVPVMPREPVVLGPPVSVTPHPDRVALRIGAHRSGVDVTVRVAAAGDRAPPISLQIPQGWNLDSGAGEVFRIVPPSSLAPGLAEISVLAGGAPAWSTTRVAYDHIRPVEIARPSVVRVLALDVDLPETTRIGHIAGGSDRAATDLAQLGLAIEAITDADLAAGDFTRFDTILVGIFALRTRSIAPATVSKLRAWIEAGGNLVTLYHRPMDGWPAEAPPMPITIGMPSLRWRVTNPSAPVTPLVPDHPLLTMPNRIGPADWDGWVKERGLYFAKSWDAAYEPLLSLADPGEEPHRGALLAGRFGRGRHVHAALALHTQLANLVPGAYRIMANLLAKPT